MFSDKNQSITKITTILNHVPSPHCFIQQEIHLNLLHVGFLYLKTVDNVHVYETGAKRNIHLPTFQSTLNVFRKHNTHGMTHVTVNPLPENDQQTLLTVNVVKGEVDSGVLKEFMLLTECFFPLTDTKYEKKEI